jgi:hypothetical protein
MMWGCFVVPCRESIGLRQSILDSQEVISRYCVKELWIRFSREKMTRYGLDGCMRTGVAGQSEDDMLTCMYAKGLTWLGSLITDPNQFIEFSSMLSRDTCSTDYECYHGESTLHMRSDYEHVKLHDCTWPMFRKQ